MNTDKQKFLDTLKYGKHYNEILKEITEFKEFVVNKKNGTASIHYNKKNKQFIITTYIPEWKQISTTLDLYTSAEKIFESFIEKENPFLWDVDEKCGSGIVKYYVYVDEYPFK